MKNLALFSARPGRRRASGFTLIELLIVVAIIAILAAIAVPNFLEAQTRAKTARVKADMRTLATAIELYAIDHNRPPLGFQEIFRGSPPPYPTTRRYRNMLGYGGNQVLIMAHPYNLMTTPVAFVTTIPQDPFYVSEFTGRQTDPRDYRIRAFYTFNTINWRLSKGYWHTWKWRASHQKGHVWGLQGVGPGKVPRENPPYVQSVLADATYVRVVGTRHNIGPFPGCDGIYDPTNGTISTGRMYRTNKGIIRAGGM